MAYEDIRLERDGQVAVLTLARPKALNALRAQTVNELNSAIDEIEADEQIKVVVLAAEGERAFSSGVDLVNDPAPKNTVETDRIAQRNARMMERLWYLDRVLITSVKGVALAAGCNLALIGDLTVCGESASFGEPEIRHGTLSPLLLLPWLTHFKVMNHMYFTGDSVSAQEAYRIGLVNKVVPDDQVDEAAIRMAKRIANAPLLTLQAVKRSVRMMYDTQGFRGLQMGHRFADTLVLDSTGVPERDRLREIRAEHGLKAFLQARDTPYREDA
ncbi:enoyl-CoA hydratase/isomerase family protein [Thermobifida cellulosilytica]|uniref:enoyl-CoA hydratase/isomerase family protein n=1 Tax=Thermobifida cellulosilytica TaxID=144786 RepID=UPI0008384B76|nr:enoyl-CoA hydratase/isomerase family protein [Thermobifida cellulosilytica]